MSILFSVSQWSAWVGDADVGGNLTSVNYSETPDVQAIPPMLRRRLNLQGRACAAEVLKRDLDFANLPIVYCSRHGDIERTLAVLQELASNELVSPMQFSLAVHNAIAGVLSIQSNNHGNLTAISGGDQPLLATLLEAAGLIQQGESQVLCIVCDIPLPEVFASPEVGPESPYALSFLIEPEATGDRAVQLAMTSGPVPEKSPSPLDFIAFLQDDQAVLSLAQNKRCWRLSSRSA